MDGWPAAKANLQPDASLELRSISVLAQEFRSWRPAHLGGFRGERKSEVT